MKIGLFNFPVRFANIHPIDIAYLSSYLKSRGHQVYVRDFNIECPVSNDCDEGFWKQYENQRVLFNKNKKKAAGWVKEILDFDPEIIGMSVWESQLYFSSEIARLIKKRRRRIKIVFGGPWCSVMRWALQVIKLRQVDYVVIGEGEATLTDIVDSQNSKYPIPGCLRKIGTKVLDGGWREETIEPDSIPFPDYDYADFDKYLLGATYPILFNRGCDWNCSFCSCHTTWRKFRSRSAENILAEIQHCFAKYPFITKFYSCDHAINANLSLLHTLCNLIIERSIKNTAFVGFARINRHMIDEQLLRKLKKAGFSDWGVGVQSGSDRILKSMRRPYTAAEAERMLKEMYNHGMRLFIDFIIGYPEETEDDFTQTLGFISRVARFVENISVAPYCHIGGNDLEYNYRKYGIYVLNEGRDNMWESANSTPAIRARRYKTVIDHLSSLKISHRYSDQDREFTTQLIQQ